MLEGRKDVNAVSCLVWTLVWCIIWELDFSICWFLYRNLQPPLKVRLQKYDLEQCTISHAISHFVHIISCNTWFLSKLLAIQSIPRACNISASLFYILLLHTLGIIPPMPKMVCQTLWWNPQFSLRIWDLKPLTSFLILLFADLISDTISSEVIFTFLLSISNNKFLRYGWTTSQPCEAYFPRQIDLFSQKNALYSNIFKLLLESEAEGSGP